MNISSIGPRPAFKSLIVEKAAFNKKESEIWGRIDEEIKPSYLSGDIFHCTEPDEEKKDYCLIKTYDRDGSTTTKKQKDEIISKILTDLGVKHKRINPKLELFEKYGFDESIFDSNYAPKYMFKA